MGTQFGDEGKGKIVDLLSGRFDVVARFNGGANAGHTVVVGPQRFAFRLLPSGAVRGKQVAIGNGVVVEPDQLVDEISEIENRTGLNVRLWLSDRAHVVMPYHKILDGAERALQGGLSAGSTGRGIAPCYGDKAYRTGIRVGDLVDEESLRSKLAAYYPLKKAMLEAYGLKIGSSEEELVKGCLKAGKALSSYIADTSLLMNRALDEGKALLLEGAQGTHLDVDHGIYPYGTSSNATAGGAFTGTGIPPTRICEVVGVVKAYTSRVGEGPFPTEIREATGERIREKGGEYGTVTRRPRRCGWLDLVMVRYAIRINGVSSIALTKLDVLGGLPQVRVAVAYERNGEELKEFPSNIRALSECRPVYESLQGWNDFPPARWKEIAGEGFDALPARLAEYVAYIEDCLKVKASMLSLGQDRDATVVRNG